MIIVGAMLSPIVIAIVLVLKLKILKKSIKILLESFITLTSILYMILSIVTKTEPFDFNIKEPGDYIIKAAVIFVFSPCLWAVLYYYCSKLFKNIKVAKNAKIRNNKKYIYYRDDLNKISPNIIMFTSTLEVDVRKSIAVTILKLKLDGYIEEKKTKLKCTDKNQDKLLESEKMILKYIETNSFDQILYKKTVEEETINLKYVKKNNMAKLFKILKILIIAIIPYLLITSSMKFDKFVFKNYNTYNFDGIDYVHLTNDEEVAYLLENNIIDKNDYKHEYVEAFDRDFYNYTYIRADKFEYAIVRKQFILNILVPVTILVSVASVVVAALKVIEEFIYINKNYKRTIKGTELLNKAYALKNYLKDYSLIKEKNAKELALWENYLIYAVALDVNTKIEDEIIEKYVNI